MIVRNPECTRLAERDTPWIHKVCVCHVSHSRQIRYQIVNKVLTRQCLYRRIEVTHNEIRDLTPQELSGDQIEPKMLACKNATQRRFLRCSGELLEGSLHSGEHLRFNLQ